MVKKQQDTYLTPPQCAAKYGGDRSTWRRAAATGRIIGAVHYGRDWLIPDMAAQVFAEKAKFRGKYQTKGGGEV